MKFKELILKNNWQSISSHFLKLYPEAEKNLDGFKMVFEKLLTMKPEKIDMSIVITKVISGIHNNPTIKEKKYPQGIEFTPWSQWLGMDISNESLAHFSEEEITVHCLYEMTFVGFEEEEIQQTLTRSN